jgi:hypothetical protein
MVGKKNWKQQPGSKKGLRPRPAAAGLFPKPMAFPDQQERKYTVGFENVFAARGDPTSPARTQNRTVHDGYDGQAARPPRQGFFLRLSGELRLSIFAINLA